MEQFLLFPLCHSSNVHSLFISCPSSKHSHPVPAGCVYFMVPFGALESKYAYILATNHHTAFPLFFSCLTKSSPPTFHGKACYPSLTFLLFIIRDIPVNWSGSGLEIMFLQ